MAAVVRGLSKLSKNSLIRCLSCSSTKFAGVKHIDSETHTGQDFIFAGNRSTSELSTNQRRDNKKPVFQQGGTDSAPNLSWEKEDYRRARFVDKDKTVNENFAIDLIAEDPIVVCTQRRVWSNSGGALGHPKVYINLDKPEVGICGYSGRKFIQKKYYNEVEHGPSVTYEEYMKEMKS